MKKSILILSACILLIPLSSCEFSLGDYREGMDEPQKLVLTSFIEPGENIRAELTHTRPFPHAGNENYVANPIIKVYINDVFAGSLKKSLGSLTVFESKLLARHGDRVKLVAEAPGYTPASGESTIPSPMPVIQVDTLTLYQQLQERLQYKIHIPDDGNGIKYYRILLKGEMPSLIYPEQMEWYPIDKDFRKEPIFDENRHFNELGGSDDENKDSNRYAIFTNRSFLGKGYTLTVSSLKLYQQVHESVYTEAPRITVTIMQLTREAYLYLQGINASEENSDDMVEPIQIFSNIENGIGIVGGYVSYSVTFIMPPLE